MSICIDINDLYNEHCKKLPIELYTPILYCILLYVCILPFLRYKLPTINPYLTAKSNRFLDSMTYFYATIFFIILFVSLSRINQVITSNSLAEIRNEQYSGDSVSFYNHLSGIPRYICAICSILAPSGTIMIMVFMYNIAFRKKGLVFNILTICGSMSQMLIAINIADRSNFIYWILMLGLGITIFYKYFSRKSKFAVLVFVSIVLFTLLSYFIAVSISRFEDRKGGTSGSLIVYAGESYINFCNFISYVEPGNSLCEIFPFLNRLVGGEGYFDAADKVYHNNSNGIRINVFSTFLGFIYSISGFWIMLIFAIIYNRLATLALKSHSKYITLKNLIRIWAAALVPVLGLFVYYYAFANFTIGLVIWLLISNKFKTRKYLTTYSFK